MERNTGNQESRFARAFAVLEDGIRQRAFPGASAAVVFRGDLVALRGIGRFTYDAEAPAVEEDTVYDVASLTKALATTPVAMFVHQQGSLDLEAPVVSLAPEFETGDRQRNKVTIRMLLAHSSGLPAYVKLFETCKTREELLRAAMQTPLEAEPGSRAAYSDIGFIVLGEILERITGESLDAFSKREIFDKLGMDHTLFCPPESMRERIPPTEDDQTFRNRVMRGEVEDENAWVMGGIAGHAGLFANVEDVARFAQCTLDGGAPVFKPETVELFTRRETSPAGTSRALGWDTPSSPSQSGQYFSPRSFGHLGYTGTSLWIDPERDLAVVLLTNRTWPDRKSLLIKQIRPRFHDAVAEALR